MFKFLRSKAKFFYWVIAASFILFIFLAWGMDFRTRRGTSPRSDLIGSVNGYAITARDWDTAYQAQLAQLRQQNSDRPLSANQVARASEQIWQSLVRDRLVEAEIARLGLTATDEEILKILKDDPPPALLAYFQDEEGNPDLAAYMDALRDPNRDWTAAENYLRYMLPRMKLQQLIVSSAVVTEAELREAYNKQKGRAIAEYVGVLYSDLESDYEPNDGEIQAYYDEHPGLYHRERRAVAHVVTWPKEPSVADREDVLTLARDIKGEIENGTRDFAEAAAVFSQDGTASSGGDLGTFDRNRMVAPFTEVAFSLPVGQISDPVETQFGYHLIEVLERIEEDGEVTQVHARHILLKIEPSNDTLLEIYTKIEDYLNATTPKQFLQTALADSLNVISPAPFAAGRDIPGVRNSMEGNLFAHQAKPGALSPILQNDESYYVVLLDNILPEGPAALDEVKSQVVAKLKEAHQRRLAAEKLSPAVGLIQMGKNFAEASEEFGLVTAVTDTFTATANIPDIGYGTAFNTVALATQVGTLIPEVETRRGLFALRTLWKEPFDENDFLAQKDGLRAMLLSQKQRELEESWYAEQEARAEIVDNRNQLRSGMS